MYIDFGEDEDNESISLRKDRLWECINRKAPPSSFPVRSLATLLKRMIYNYLPRIWRVFVFARMVELQHNGTEQGGGIRCPAGNVIASSLSSPLLSPLLCSATPTTDTAQRDINCVLGKLRSVSPSVHHHRLDVSFCDTELTAL